MLKTPTVVLQVRERFGLRQGEAEDAIAIVYDGCV